MIFGFKLNRTHWSDTKYTTQLTDDVIKISNNQILESICILIL